MTSSTLLKINQTFTPEEKAISMLNLKKRNILSKDVREYLEQTLNDAHPLIRFAAARTLARALGENSPDKALDVLLMGMENHKEIRASYNPLPTTTYDVIHDACLSVCLAGKHKTSRVLPRLEAIIDSSTNFGATSIAFAILYLLFEETDKIKSSQDLTHDQLNSLLLILESKRAWVNNGNMAEMLERFGLPQTRNELKRWLHK